MLSQIQHLAQKGLQTDFLKSLSSPSITNDYIPFHITFNDNLLKNANIYDVTKWVVFVFIHESFFFFLLI